MNKKFTDLQIKQFWLNHDRFLKNNLVTEAPNPQTHNLSQLCHNDLLSAFNLFQQVELDAISHLTRYLPDIERLQQHLSNTLDNNGRIFLMGCGASGRLAMLLKRLWEHYNPHAPKQITCVSSAGDVSLIKAVEQFEDNEAFGVKQLLEQGFTKQDLLIGLSASGESPFILAAIEYAIKYSIHKPYLIYNNSTTSLIERNPNHIITNPQMFALELDVGAMALTGSTRLQATTAMQIALGLALCKPNTQLKNELEQIIQIVKNFCLKDMSEITTLEAGIVAKDEYILYQTNNSLLGLSILADTTERAPTFNLPSYENNTVKENQYSPFYLSLTQAHSVTDAWQFLLGNTPTCLNWPNFPATSNSYINGFDLSGNSQRLLGKYLPKPQHIANWILDNCELSIKLLNQTVNFTIPEDFLQATIIYKLCLNSHSTLMMGRNKYFYGNMMISLKPSNFKLIDRAIRYSKFILEHQHKIVIEYKQLANIVFQQIEELEPNQSIVQKTINSVLRSL